MLEKVNVNNNEYVIQKDLTFGQIKKINKSFGTALKQEELPDMTTMSTDEILKIKPKLENSIKMTEDQLELVADIIKYSLDLNDEGIEKIPFHDVEQLYNEILKANQPKKKLNQQYA